MDSDETKKRKETKLIDEVDSLIKHTPDQGLPNPNHSKRASKDVSNGIADRRSSYLEQAGNTVLQQLAEHEYDDLFYLSLYRSKQKAEKQRKCRHSIGMFLNSRMMDYIIIFLVGMFLCITFINFSFTSSDASENETIALTLEVVLIIEMCILTTFIIEIALKSYSFGVKVYFKDRWLVFDAIVIVLSIIFVILDWTLTNASFKTSSKVIRGVFRFLRLFLVFRKFNQAKAISVTSTRYNVRSPIEKVVEIIKSMQEQFDDPSIKKELKWSIEKITSNLLYEPLIESNDQNQQAASQWVQSMQQKKHDDTPLIQEKNSTKNKSTSSKRVTLKLNVPPDVLLSFEEEIKTLGFDCFDLYDNHHHLMLPYLLDYLFDNHGIYSRLQIDPEILHTFGEKIAQGYRDNPYHNVIHAFDVTQTVNFFLTECGFKEIAQLGSLDICTMIVAAAIHDYDHPGTNNPYQINARTDLATTYNDKSPLENHHVAQTFLLMREEQYDILRKLTPQDQKYVRERLIGMILATDMAVHFADLAKLKVRLVSPEFDPHEKDKVICMESLLHAADVSNPFKPTEIYEKWTHRVLAEFWQQGDKERAAGLPISYLCDRYTTNTAKSQIGFIDFVVFPFYDTVSQLLPLMSQWMPHFESNKIHWKERIEHYEEELKNLVHDEVVNVKPV